MSKAYCPKGTKGSKGVPSRWVEHRERETVCKCLILPKSPFRSIHEELSRGQGRRDSSSLKRGSKQVMSKTAAAAAKSLQSCPTLCDPIEGSPPGSPHPWDSPGKNAGVGCHFLLQCMKVKSEVKSLSRARLLATPWTAAFQAPPSMGFSRQEYWSGVPLPSLVLRIKIHRRGNTQRGTVATQATMYPF